MLRAFGREQAVGQTGLCSVVPVAASCAPNSLTSVRGVVLHRFVRDIASSYIVVVDAALLDADCRKPSSGWDHEGKAHSLAAIILNLRTSLR